MFLPGSEVAHLAVVSVVGKPHLGSDEENLVVVHDDAAVVEDVLMDYRPGNLAFKVSVNVLQC